MSVISLGLVFDLLTLNICLHSANSVSAIQHMQRLCDIVSRYAVVRHVFI